MPSQAIDDALERQGRVEPLIRSIERLNERVGALEARARGVEANRAARFQEHIAPAKGDIADARQHIEKALAALESSYQTCIHDGLNIDALNIDHVIYDLRRINGEHDTKPWAHEMSLARLEGARNEAPEGKEKP